MFVLIALLMASLPRMHGLLRPAPSANLQLRADDAPRWANGGPISAAVNALISFPPLFSLLKRGARRVLIDTAERNAVPWTQRAAALRQAPTLTQHFQRLNDAAVEYPDYYLRPFHAYDSGNLNWEAACECESATYSMALRVWPQERLDAAAAQRRLRASFTDRLRAYVAEHGAPCCDVLDVGCSVGLSTFALADAFPTSAITGLDLSPYMLAVAQCRQEELLAQDGVTATDAVRRITWRHDNMERTRFGDASFDVISASFVFHELPQSAAGNIAAESLRLLRPGGVFAMTDNDPQSPVIRNLPPAIFTLMKSTEPWSDQYYRLNIPQLLQDAGFVDVVTCATDPRHRTITARKPATV